MRLPRSGPRAGTYAAADLGGSRLRSRPGRGMRSPGCSRPGRRCGPWPERWAGPRPRSVGRCGAIATPAPAGTSRNGPTGWPGNVSNDPSRPSWLPARCCARPCRACSTSGTHRSRSPAGYGSSTPRTRRCRSVTRRSTRASTSIPAVGCAASSRPACAAAGRYAAHAASAPPAVRSTVWCRSTTVPRRSKAVWCPATGGTWDGLTTATDSAVAISRTLPLILARRGPYGDA